MEVLAFIIIIVLAFWLQTYIFEKWVFTRLQYTCTFNKYLAYEGDNIMLVETVHNNKILPLQWLKVEIHSSRWLDFAQTRSVVAQESRFVTSGFFLKSYQKTTRTWKVKCLKRGLFTTGSVTLVAGDLFGHSIKSMPVQVNLQLLVYPKPVNLEALFINPNHSLGDHIVKHWIMDDPFLTLGTREYTPQDPMNRIHWQSTASHGTLMVRNNEYTNDRKLDIILNIQSMEYEYTDVVNKGIIELAIKVAATIIMESSKTGLPIRFICNGSNPDNDQRGILTISSSGHIHTDALLTLLAKLQLKKAIEFEDYLESFIYSLDSNNMIIITAYLSDRLCQILSQLKFSHLHINILLLDDHIEPNIKLVNSNIHLLMINMKNVLTKNEIETFFGVDEIDKRKI